MRISILTATYNRAHLLFQLYQSLVKNHEIFSDFEWLIMDDGSIDDTEKLVAKWMREGIIEIHYYKQKNSGKMAAINNLHPYVTGDIWIEIDSDDYFTEHILKKIAQDYKSLDADVYGVLYYRKFSHHTIKKDPTLQNKILKLYDFHYKYGYTYDTVLTYRTSVRKQFYYELEANEKFVTEARTYYKIDQVGKGFLIQNDDALISNYEEDGYSKNITQYFVKYPHGYFHYFLELLNYPSKGILFKKRLYMIKHYILFGYLTNTSFFNLISGVHGFHRFLVILLYIPGKWKSSKKFPTNKLKK